MPAEDLTVTVHGVATPGLRRCIQKEQVHGVVTRGLRRRVQEEHVNLQTVCCRKKRGRPPRWPHLSLKK